MYSAILTEDEKMYSAKNFGGLLRKSYSAIFVLLLLDMIEC